ncbi:hypothetical protein DFJ77DRAFT_127641 [Powellomyces hirtus]|nr:hypothetical protein DFJ77DRAFT_127641 [Powellomyces hirtus]
MYGQQHHQQMPPRTPGRQAQAPLAPSTTNVTSSSTPTPSVPPMLRSSTSNPFLRPSTPTFTTYRGRRHSPRLDDDDDDDDSRDEDEDLESVASSDLVVTPLPRRRIPQFQRHHSKPTSGLALNVVTPNKGRRMSDGMVVVGNDTGDELMACDGPGGSPRTPRRDSGRRGSLLCGKSLVRIAALLRDESNPLDKEIAHERALNTSQSLLFPSGATPDTTMLDTTAVGTASGGGVDTMPPPSPADSACATPPPSFGSRAMSLSVPDDNGRPGTPDEMNALAAAATPPAVPVRAVAIPNSALKDPATYVSHSSKLNPENNSNIFTRPHHHKKHDEMMLLSSPCLSPIHPSVMPFGNMSPVNLERKCKRKRN